MRLIAEDLVPKSPPGAPGSVNWTPIGPAFVTRGQAKPRPTVSGRVLSLEIGPLGRRAYAAAADGGVWRYDRLAHPAGGFADTWTPVDDFVMSPNMVNTASSNSLAASALLVRFGATVNADTIFVGTGEPGFANAQQNLDFWSIGVRVSSGTGAPNPRVWTLEALNLAGQAIYRLVQDPDNVNVVWAATTAGLFARPAAAVAGTPWTPIGTAGANPLPAGGVVSDVVITGVGINKAIFAAVDAQGVFRSVDGGANWARLAITPNSAANPGRIALAVSNTANQVVYHWDSLGRLWRFDGIRFRRVQTLPGPASTVAAAGPQGWYDLVVAVVPGTDDTVVIAGSLILNSSGGNPLDPTDWDAAVYRSALTTAGVERRFGFVNAANPDRDPTWIGAGVHPDVHAIAFSRDAAGANLIAGETWVGCDGGAFRSPTGLPGTFLPVNETLAITQPTFFDQHPTHDSLVVTGTQDNGTIRYGGSKSWRLLVEGDGGGVAIDPNNPLQFLAQNTNATITRITDGGQSGVGTSVGPTLSTNEPSAFYTRLLASPPPAIEPSTAILYSTDRVWVTYDAGGRWRILPNNVTPGAAAAATARLDGTLITDMEWSIQNRFHVTTTQAVFRFDRTLRHAATRSLDTWTNPATALSVNGLPAVRAVTSLAVANPATDDLYVGLGGTGTGTDHVWWFDAAAVPNPVWRPAGLSLTMTLLGVAAPFDSPVTCMVVDPANPRNLYVGTDVGVFLATRSPAPPFSWAYSLFSLGLPEASVQDLKIHVPTRRLRAALHGRGMWEIDLAAGAGRDPDVYIRMNEGDGGRHLPAARSAAHPTVTGRTVNWTMSPDIRIRRGIASQVIPPFRTALRFSTPRQTGAAVTCWQAHATRRGFSLGADVTGTFGAGSRTAARAVQSRFGLTTLVGGTSNFVDGIVGRRTWLATTSWPALPTPMTAYAFEDLIGEDIDATTDEMIADATGVNQIFLQVHNRGSRAVSPGNLRALLLVTGSDSAANVANLPNGYGARLRNADTTAWLSATAWRFADPANIYAVNPLELNQRQPALLSWNVNFAALGFNPGDHVLVLALVHATTPVGDSDNTYTNALLTVRGIIEGAVVAPGETKAAARLVRLDPVVVIPPAP